MDNSHKGDERSSFMLNNYHGLAFTHRVLQRSLKGIFRGEKGTGRVVISSVAAGLDAFVGSL